VVADVALAERDPYGAGWLYRVAPTAFDAERALLFDHAAYIAWLAPRLAAKQTPPIDDEGFSVDPLRGY
jgi:hypothetical protein